MKAEKRIISMVLVLVMLLCTMPITASAEQRIVDSGECGTDGDNVLWTLYDDGELEVSGSGEMKNYDSYTSVPWDSYKWESNGLPYSIDKVTIKGDITSIGKYAFAYCRLSKNRVSQIKRDTVFRQSESLNMGDFF